MSQNELEYNDSNSVFVNSLNGQDTNDGTRDSPYRSVTKALSTYQNNDNIETYNIVFLNTPYVAISNEESHGINVNLDGVIKFVNESNDYVEFNDPFNISCNSFNAGNSLRIGFYGNFIFNGKITLDSNSVEPNSIDISKDYVGVPCDVVLNNGLRVGKNVGASIYGLDFRNVGLLSIDSRYLYINDCTFTDLDNTSSQTDCNAISVINCAHNINLCGCYINCNEAKTLDWHSLRGIYLHGICGDIDIFQNIISNTDFNAIQITNARSDIKINDNEFREWDFDNDGFLDAGSNIQEIKSTSGGRAVRIDVTDGTNISITGNKFIKIYKNTPSYINSHEYECNQNMPVNAYDDGNILKISAIDSSNLLSFAFLNNTLQLDDLDSTSLLFSSENSHNYLILPDDTVPSIAEFKELDISNGDIETVYGKSIYELVKDFYIHQSDIIQFHGFLPYVSGFNGYWEDNVEMQEGNYVVFKINLPSGMKLSDLSSVDGNILYKTTRNNLTGDITTTEYAYKDISKDFGSDYNEDSNYIFFVLRINDELPISLDVDWDGNALEYIRSNYDLFVDLLELGLKNPDDIAITAPLVDQNNPSCDITPDDYSLEISAHAPLDNSYKLYLSGTGVKEYENSNNELGYWVGVAIPVPDQTDLEMVSYRLGNDYMQAKSNDFVNLGDDNRKYICFYVNANNENPITHLCIDWNGSGYFMDNYWIDVRNVSLSVISDEIKTAPLSDNPPLGQTPISTDGVINYDLQLSEMIGAGYNIINVTAENVPYHRNANGDWGYWVGIGFKAPINASLDDAVVYAGWITNDGYRTYASSFDGMDGEYYTFYFNVGSENNVLDKARLNINWGNQSSDDSYIIDFSGVSIDDLSPYTIGFDSNGGSDVSYQSISDGQKITKPTDPVKEGYVLVGWYADADLTTPWDFNTEISSDLTIYAKWGYSVVFISDDKVIETKVVEVGQTVTAPDEPQKDGYVFDGWYSDQEFTQKWIFEYNRIYETTQVYAKWYKFCDVTIKIYDTNNKPWTGLDVYLAYHNHSTLVQIELKESNEEPGSYLTVDKISSGETFYYLWIGESQYFGNSDRLTITDDQTYEIKNVCSLTLDMSQYISNAVGSIYLESNSWSINDFGFNDDDFSDWGYNFGGWYLDKNHTLLCDSDSKITENTYIYLKLIPINGSSTGGGGGVPITPPPVVPDEPEPIIPDSNGNVDVVIDDKKADELVHEAVSSGSDTITILDTKNVSGNVSSVTVSTTDLETISKKIENNNNIDSVSIETSNGDIIIEKEVLSSILENTKAESVSFEVEDAKNNLTEEQKKAVGDRPVYDINIKAGNENVTSFNGKTITISLPYTLKAGEDPKNIVVYYVKEDGSLDKINCEYKNGKVIFDTDPLSKYVIGYEEQDKPVTPDTPDDKKESSNNTIYYAVAAVIIILIIIALAYYFMKKKQ